MPPGGSANSGRNRGPGAVDEHGGTGNAVAAAAATPGAGIIAMFDTFLAEHRDFLIAQVTAIGCRRSTAARFSRRAAG